MILLYFALLFGICIIMMFSYSLKINGINQIIYSTPRSLFETAIPLTIQEDEVELYYDKERLKYNYESYLDKEVKKYVDSYSVEYYFYDVSNGGYCDIKNCQGVEISFKAYVMLGITYERVMNYEIKEGKIHG